MLPQNVVISAKEDASPLKFTVQAVSHVYGFRV